MKRLKPKKRNPPANRTRLDHIDPDGTVWFASVLSSELAGEPPPGASGY